MGQRERDICAGVPTVKIFWPPTGNWGRICHRFATVDRKDRDINELDKKSSVTRGAVVEAAERIAGLVERTPLIESEIAGSRVWLKCECLQTGGAFKLRGGAKPLLAVCPAEG